MVPIYPFPAMLAFGFISLSDGSVIQWRMRCILGLKKKGGGGGGRGGGGNYGLLW